PVRHQQITIPAADIEIGIPVIVSVGVSNAVTRVTSLRAYCESAESQTVGVGHQVGEPAVIVECLGVTGAGGLGYTPGAYDTETHTVLGSLDGAVGNDHTPLVVYYIAHSGVADHDVRIDVIS